MTKTIVPAKALPKSMLIAALLYISASPAFSQEADTTAVPESPPARVFSEPILLAQEYLFGVVGSAVFGAVGFYSGKGIERLIRDSDYQQGTLGFTGVRYTNFDGGFRGGALGLSVGATLGAYFAGQLDEEDGSFWWTYAGTVLGTGAGLFLADALGVENGYKWEPLLPLLALPAAGGVVGFNVSRYFRDQRRREITGSAQGGVMLLPPTLAMVPMGPGGKERGYHLNALNLRF